jgi:hypothetical protein
MAQLRSPGVVIREKDLTNGRASIANANVAAFAGPFPKGELGAPVTIRSEAQLVSVFGEPNEYNADYVLSALNYLNYGGTLSVVRADNANLKNSVARVGNAVTDVTITNPDTNGKYISNPAVTFDAPPAGGVTAEGTSTIDVNGRVTGVVITIAGNGYQSAPAITIDPVGQTALATVAQGTTATATADGSNIAGDDTLQGTLTITDAGSGYTSLDPSDLVISGGGGTGGVVTPVITNGQITSLTLSGGSNYTTAPTITIAAPKGVVVNITSGGTNYDPTNTYSVNVNGGQQNTAFAGTLIVNNSGIVTGVSVSNFGEFTNFSGISTVIEAPGLTATATSTISANPIKIANEEVYNASYNGTANGWLYAGKTPGTWTNGLRVCTVDFGPQQSLVLTSGANATPTNTTVGEFVTVGSKKGEIIDVTTQASSGQTVVHVVILDTLNNDAYVNDPSAGQMFDVADSVNIGTSGSSVIESLASTNTWYEEKPLYQGSSIKWNAIAARPKATADAEAFYGSGKVWDAIHVAIVDTNGTVSGSIGTVIEQFTYLSKATDGKGPQGGANFYKRVVSDSSNYIYVGDSNYEPQVKTSALGFKPKGASDHSLENGANYAGGSSEYNVGIDDLLAAYDTFSDVEQVTVDYILMGPECGTETDTKSKLNKIAQIAADRKDCIAFGSAHKGNIVSVDGTVKSNSVITKNLKSFFSDVSSNSYLVIDGNYKYIYDRYNDVYKYIPCNTDVAGLVADTAIRNEPWFSPAGFSRGGIRNLAKLAWNPSKADRDDLYANRINPIVTFPGQGAVLFGDKTALSTPSAFDRINVRKLFLTVERAIEEAAKAQLFEINDEVTRGVFRAIVEPFLRDVQSRRGITDFLVVCDETNNTPAVIDNNEFYAEIYIQPARSINFITLTFTATRTGIDFSEVIAK